MDGDDICCTCGKIFENPYDVGSTHIYRSGYDCGCIGCGYDINGNYVNGYENPCIICKANRIREYEKNDTKKLD